MDEDTDGIAYGRTRFAQTGQRPPFRDDGTEAFLCAGCANVLVEGYVPRKLIAIEIRCDTCGMISRTALWPVGEPLPLRKFLFTTGAGTIDLADTVDLAGKDLAVICDQEADRLNRLTKPRPPARSGINLQPEGIEKLEARIRSLGGDFDVLVASTEAAFAQARQHSLKFPPIWALVRLRASLAAGKIDIDSSDGVALNYLTVLTNIVERWGHVERFPAIARELIFDFPHAITQMMAASYLSDVGNQIGFAVPVGDGQRTPDMYANLSHRSALSLEVKAPESLQWPNPAPSRERFAKIVMDKIKSTRRQLTNDRGGMLILGSSIAEPSFHSMATGVVEELAKAERLSMRLAGVVLVSVFPGVGRVGAPEALEREGGSHTLAMGGQVAPILNPRSKWASLVRTSQ